METERKYRPDAAHVRYVETIKAFFEYLAGGGDTPTQKDVREKLSRHADASTSLVERLTQLGKSWGKLGVSFRRQAVLFLIDESLTRGIAPTRLFQLLGADDVATFFSHVGLTSSGDTLLRVRPPEEPIAVPKSQVGVLLIVLHLDTSHLALEELESKSLVDGWFRRGWEELVDCGALEPVPERRGVYRLSALTLDFAEHLRVDSARAGLRAAIRLIVSRLGEELLGPALQASVARHIDALLRHTRRPILPLSDHHLEVELLVSIATVFMLSGGYDINPSVSNRALELFERGVSQGDASEALGALWFRYAHQLPLVQGKYAQVQRSAEALTGQPFAMLREHALGESSLCQGDLVRAEQHLSKVVTLGGELRHPTAQTFTNARMAASCYLALVYCLQGRMGLMREVLEVAQRYGADADPANQAYALIVSADVSYLTRDRVALQRHASMALGIARAGGVALFEHMANVFLGWLAAHEGDVAASQQMKSGLDGLKAIGLTHGRSFWLSIFVDGLLLLSRTCPRKASLLAKCELALDEARGHIAVTNEGFIAPELRRLEGELLRARRQDDAGRRVLSEGHTAAKEQGATLLELKASLALARAGDVAPLKDGQLALEVAIAEIEDGEDLADVIEARELLDGMPGS